MTTTPTTPADPAQPPAPAQAPPEAPPAAPEEKPEPDWKAESRKWESRAKENLEKAKQYDALEEAKKTEQQRLEERAAKAEQDHQAAQTEAARLRVALEKGLTPAQAKRLVGTTEEELSADADELLADLQPGRPRGDVAQGPRGQQPAPTGDPSQDFANFMKGQLGR